MVLNLIKIYDITRNGDELVRMLRAFGLIPKENEYQCTKCKNVLKLQRKSDRYVRKFRLRLKLRLRFIFVLNVIG